jgi:hypothetical protein
VIGWAEVGPDLLRALTITRHPFGTTPDEPVQAAFAGEPTTLGRAALESSGKDRKPNGASVEGQSTRTTSTTVNDDLLERAGAADEGHWDQHRRPISADTLRRKLRIGAARSRLLVSITRADSQRRPAPD